MVRIEGVNCVGEQEIKESNFQLFKICLATHAKFIPFDNDGKHVLVNLIDLPFLKAVCFF